MNAAALALVLLIPGPQDPDVGTLVKRLDSDVPKVREQATAALVRKGPKILEALRKASKEATSREVKARLSRVIRRLEWEVAIDAIEESDNLILWIRQRAGFTSPEMAAKIAKFPRFALHADRKVIYRNARFDTFTVKLSKAEFKALLISFVETGFLDLDAEYDGVRGQSRLFNRFGGVEDAGRQRIGIKLGDASHELRGPVFHYLSHHGDDEALQPLKQAMKLLRGYTHKKATRVGLKDWWILTDQDGEVRAVRPDGKKSESLPDSARHPKGKRRFRVRTNDGDAEIWVSDADGGNEQKLTDNEAIDNMPRWAADGKKIVFGSTRSGKWQIWVMDADGGNPRRLTDHPEGAWRPEVSSKGGRICYRARSGRRGKLPPSDLMVMGLDGKEAWAVVKEESIVSASWSPDGKRLAYSTPGRLEVYDLGKKKVIHTTEFKEIDKDLHAHGAFNIVWRPDGKAMACQITFLGGRMVGTRILGDDELFVVPLEGTVRMIECSGRVRPLRWVKR